MSDQPATTPSRPEAPRVSVAFTAYRVHREALLLAREERRRLAADFVAAATEGASKHLGLVRSYSFLGTRADADLLLWQAAPTPEGLQGFASALRATELAPYLERPYHYLSLTRRSMYLERHAGDPGRAVVKPEGSRYLFVYPFVKTRAWYAL
ncbi:MAG TPA: chlorite dismutase family protein, partial [Chloroflexota bacterium]|nr:chlorite dismutase family protein [Chloroflexota bacterium]